MVIPGTEPNGEHVRRMLPHGCHHINQRWCHCHKRAIKLRRKVVSLFHLGHVVVRRLYFLRLLLGWRSRYVRLEPYIYILGGKTHPTIGSHSRIIFWKQ